MTLDGALALALEHNRGVTVSVLEEQELAHDVSISRSRRLPQFHFDVLAGSLLHPFDFTFPAGSFGSYPGVGPVPSTDAKIETPAQFTSSVTAAVDQPLTQLHKIKLGIVAAELAVGVAREGVRVERQKVAAEVRKAYFDLVASQTALEASRETVTTLEEVQRVTAQYEAQQTVLRGDALEVGARLAKSRYELSTAENRVETQREVLNDLMGRDLATRFRIEPIPEQNAEDLGLEAARERATENRPEIRQAQLREKQADCERRLARADYIPDLSLSVRYVGLYNFEVLPTHVTTAGLYLSWEPFDWGRRRNRVAEKVKAADRARTGARQTESTIEIEVGQTYRAWHDAALLVSAARAEHEAAREQLRVTAARYQEQAALLKDVLQFEARSAEADSQYQQALSSFWGARAELQRVMGEE